MGTSLTPFELHDELIIPNLGRIANICSDIKVGKIISKTTAQIQTTLMH